MAWERWKKIWSAANDYRLGIRDFSGCLVLLASKAVFLLALRAGCGRVVEGCCTEQAEKTDDVGPSGGSDRSAAVVVQKLRRSITFQILFFVFFRLCILSNILSNIAERLSFCSSVDCRSRLLQAERKRHGPMIPQMERQAPWPSFDSEGIPHPWPFEMRPWLLGMLTQR